MFAVVASVGLIALRVTIAVIRFGLVVSRIAAKAVIAVVVISTFVVLSMPRMLGT